MSVQIPDGVDFAALAQQRRYAQIIAQADAILAAQPGSADVLRWKAVAHRGLADYFSASQTIQTALADHPDDLSLKIEEAAIALERGSLDTALFRTEQVLAADAANEFALSIRAGSLLKRNSNGDAASAAQLLGKHPLIGTNAPITAKYAAALRAESEANEDTVLQLVLDALKLDSCEETALTIARELLIDRDDIATALRCIEAALAVNPDQHHALTELAQYHLAATGDVEKALAAARKAQEIAPSSWPALGAELDVLSWAGHLSEAIDRLKKATNFTNLELWIIFYLWQSCRYDEAHALLEQLSADGRVDADWYRHKIWTFLGEGRLADAGLIAVDAQKLDEPYLRYAIAAVRLYQRRFDEADELSRHPGNVKLSASIVIRINSLCHQRRFADAEQLADEALSRTPRDRSVRARKAWLLGNRGEFKAAEAIFEDLLRRRPPQDHEIPALYADVLYQRGALAKAGALCDQWLVNFPYSTDLLLIIGQICLEKGRHDEAIAFIDRAIKVTGAYTVSIQLKCIALFSCGRQQEAWDLVAAARLQFPNSAGLVAIQGWLWLFDYGDITRAQALFEAALEDAPGCVLALFGLGAIALRRRAFADAEHHFRQVVKSQPSSPAALTNLAWSLAVSGDRKKLDEARDQCTKVLAIDPGNPRADACLGVIAFNLNERSVALRHLSRAVQSQPQDLEGAVNLASLKARMGEYRAAEDLLNRVLAANALHLRALVELSQLTLKLEQTADARRYAQTAMDAHPTSAAGWLAMSAALLAENNYARAESVLREALTSVDAGEIDAIRLDLAVVLLRLGDAEQKESRYRGALEQVVLTSSDGESPDAILLQALAHLKLRNPRTALSWLAKVKARRDLLPYVEEYRIAAQQQLASESAQIGKLGVVAAVLMILQVGVLWGALFGDAISDTQFAVLLPILLALLLVSALLPYLKELKVATVEAQISREVRDFQIETLSGPRLRIDLPPEASLVVTAKTLDL
jgi:tetratricopeptide (TPR) repeat protein